MLMVSIGIYGFMRNRYWIFCIGFLLAALTRPSFTILLCSIVCTEVFFLAQHRNFKLWLANTVKRIAPLLVGTSMVSLIPYLQGSNSLLKFLEVQKYWQNILSMPHNLRDWSHEGFGINTRCNLFLIHSAFYSALPYVL